MTHARRFPRHARLRRREEIREVLRAGEVQRTGPLDIHLRQSDRRGPRVGIVVPRHGRSIARRNRLKRRLREIARQSWLPRAAAAASGEDLVVRARPEAYDLSFAELRDAFLRGTGAER